MKTKAKSFKTKLWVYFALFTAFIFLILWLLQTVFLQSFFNRMLISDTKEAAEELIKSGTKPDIEKRIDTSAKKNSLLVVVADEEGNILYSSDEFKGQHKMSSPPDEEKEPSPEPPPKKDSKEDDDISSKSRYRTLPDDYEELLSELTEKDHVEKISDDYFVYVSYIDYHGQETRSVLYISTPINAIGASVTILQKILALVTVLSLAAGFVLSWFIARRFSKPVAKLAQKAGQLGEKDYSDTFDQGFCSELDELNATLDQTNQKLLTSRDFQMQLLANVSHDLRTPLTMIKGYAEMIRDISWEDAAAMKEDIQVVIKEADRLNALVNEILEYSELQADTVRKSFEAFDLSELVNSSTERFEKLSIPDNILIEKNIEPGIMVTGDAALIERALYNLMDNAVRHTGNGRKIRVELKKAADKAVIAVRDYGKGIPSDEIEHIWERYYTSRQRDGKGVSGLGLAIVKQIVTMHNGTCRATSTEGEGCTFFIEL